MFAVASLFVEVGPATRLHFYLLVVFHKYVSILPFFFFCNGGFTTKLIWNGF